MTPTEKRHYKTFSDDVKLRNDINHLLEDFAKKHGLKASEIYIRDNDWYRGQDDAPMFSIDITYKPCYME